MAAWSCPPIASGTCPWNKAAEQARVSATSAQVKRGPTARAASDKCTRYSELKGLVGPPVR
jgi:hypothetical protein